MVNKFGVGSLHPEIAAEDVKKYKAEIGACLDGDADRVVVIDEKGEVIHGDILIGILTKFALEKKMVKKGDEIVGTVMSNMALENYVQGLGLNFYRAQVGDRYILERMRQSKALLGGEPSGHLIWPSVSRTGDGILSALKVLEAMSYFGKKLSELKSDFELYPQLTTNVKVKKKEFSNFPELTDELTKQEKRLKGKGRILLRYSGTEPLARVMVEGESMPLIQDVSDVISGVVINVWGKEIARLGVNIDHVATLRQARGESYPSVDDAAKVALENGADQNITCEKIGDIFKTRMCIQFKRLLKVITPFLILKLVPLKRWSILL